MRLKYLKKKKNELKDIVVVVTRYFGGIKLGAGGLIRAYGKSVTLGLDVSTIVKKSIFNCYKLDLNYDLLGSFEKLSPPKRNPHTK